VQFWSIKLFGFNFLQLQIHKHYCSCSVFIMDIGFESVYFFMHICFESSAIITNKSPNITKIIIFEKNMLKFKAGRKIQLLNINVWLRLPSKLVQILFLKLWCKQNQFSKLNFGLKNSIPHNQKHSILHWMKFIIMLFSKCMIYNMWRSNSIFFLTKIMIISQKWNKLKRVMQMQSYYRMIGGLNL
jgi:hypothetical protein